MGELKGNSPHILEFSYTEDKDTGLLSHPSLTEDYFLEALTALHPHLTVSGPRLLPEPEEKPQVFTCRSDPCGHRRGMGDNDGVFYKALPKTGLELRCPDYCLGLLTLVTEHLPK